jgi:hypothetical protein
MPLILKLAQMFINKQCQKHIRLTYNDSIFKAFKIETIYSIYLYKNYIVYNKSHLSFILYIYEQNTS